MICAPRNPAVLGSERFGSTVSARMPAPCDLNRVAPFPDAGNDCLPATSVPTGSFHSASGRFSFAYIHHALFELAVDAMKRAGDPTDGDAVAQAIAATKLDTLVGPIAWDGKGLPPFAAKNIAKTPLVGGQWRLKDGGGYDLVITDNKTAPNIPVGGKMEAIA